MTPDSQRNIRGRAIAATLAAALAGAALVARRRTIRRRATEPDAVPADNATAIVDSAPDVPDTLTAPPEPAEPQVRARAPHRDYVRLRTAVRALAGLAGFGGWRR